MSFAGNIELAEFQTDGVNGEGDIDLIKETFSSLSKPKLKLQNFTPVDIQAPLAKVLLTKLEPEKAFFKRAGSESTSGELFYVVAKNIIFTNLIGKSENIQDAFKLNLNDIDNIQNKHPESRFVVTPLVGKGIRINHIVLLIRDYKEQKEYVLDSKNFLAFDSSKDPKNKEEKPKLSSIIAYDFEELKEAEEEEVNLIAGSEQKFSTVPVKLGTQATTDGVFCGYHVLRYLEPCFQFLQRVGSEDSLNTVEISKSDFYVQGSEAKNSNKTYKLKDWLIEAYQAQNPVVYVNNLESKSEAKQITDPDERTKFFNNLNLGDGREKVETSFFALWAAAWREAYVVSEDVSYSITSYMAGFFFDFPFERSKTELIKWAVGWVCLGFVFYPLKNALKLCIDFLPRLLSSLSYWAAEKLSQTAYLPNLAMNILIGVLHGFSKLFQFVAFVGHAMTSPLDAWNRAGRNKVNKALVMMFALAGLVVTAALLGPTAFILLTKIMPTAAMAWLSMQLKTFVRWSGVLQFSKYLRDICAVILPCMPVKVAATTATFYVSHRVVSGTSGLLFSKAMKNMPACTNTFASRPSLEKGIAN